MDNEIKNLINAPLKDPGKLAIHGKPRTIKRGPKPEYHGDIGGEVLTSGQIRERKQDQYSAKLVAVLDYYATTDTPFERIAAHTNLPIEKVVEAMKRRGRDE